MKLGVIGGGFMGEAIIAAAVRNPDASGLTAGEIIASDISPQRRELLSKQYSVTTTDDNEKAANESQIVVLAVKPQEFPSVARQIKESLSPERTVASIMAGVRIETIRAALGHDRLVRVMPNTPAMVGEGMSVWTATESVGGEARDQVRRLLGAMGREIHVTDEKYIDMATALSASGPAFILLVMEALADAGVHIGLRRELANEMVTQMVLGTARLAQETGRPLPDLRHMVTSPGGTTAEGLLVMETARVRAALVEAIIKTYEKAKALGG